MQDWRKNRNYRKYENTDGSFTYVITVDGEKVEVSAEMYQAYAEGGYKMENMEALKSDRVLKDADGKAVRDEHGNAIMLPEREVSLDKLIEEEWDFQSLTTLPEDALIKAIELDEVHRCVALLDEREQSLIHALFFGGMTETKYAAQIGVSQQAVSKKYKVILSKLKKLIKI